TQRSARRGRHLAHAPPLAHRRRASALLTARHRSSPLSPAGLPALRAPVGPAAVAPAAVALRPARLGARPFREATPPRPRWSGPARRLGLRPRPGRDAPGERSARAPRRLGPPRGRCGPPQLHGAAAGRAPRRRSWGPQLLRPPDPHLAVGRLLVLQRRARAHPPRPARRSVRRRRPRRRSL